MRGDGGVGELDRKGLVWVLGVNDGKIVGEVPTGTMEGRGEGFGEWEEKGDGLEEGRVMSPIIGSLPSEAVTDRSSTPLRGGVREGLEPGGVAKEKEFGVSKWPRFLSERSSEETRW